jgi:hypothetical protein
MRMLLKVTFPTAKANTAIQEGRLGQELERVMNQLQPEAAYFYGENGKRTAFFVFNMEDSSQLPTTHEPLFLEFEAETHTTPVMNRDDLAKGLQQAFG